MAALVAGVQYGLSSQGNFNENKSLIYVKLTDSAYRAIEEYIRNRSKCSKAPTIQFSGNEGHLSLPSSQSARGEAAFNFSLSSNEDIEGPQGSFECVQQTSPRCLESVGALHCKMRVQANDDVYNVTRQKMAQAEELHKTKCTREIELDKSNIGRRVKLRQKPPSGGGPRAGGGSGEGANKPAPYPGQMNGFHHHQTNTMTHSSSPAPLLPSPAAPYHHHSVPAAGGPPTAGIVSAGSGAGNFKPSGRDHHGGGLHGYPGPQQMQQQHYGGRGSAKDDITRRPIRERLIHLLAVRPFKKPELLAAIQRDGLREKDKNQLTNTLSSVATQKDNTYYLMRHVWNDVLEDWPFYTEQDKQILKRRKPQNLTPPGSSDGGSSASSGQSPNSVHPGSPPSVIEPPPSAKRPGYYDGADGLQTKRQRISRVPNARPDSTTSSSFSTSASKPSPNVRSRDESSIYGKGGGGGGTGSSKYSNSSVTSAVRWSQSPTAPPPYVNASFVNNTPPSSTSSTPTLPAAGSGVAPTDHHPGSSYYLSTAVVAPTMADFQKERRDATPSASSHHPSSSSSSSFAASNPTTLAYSPAPSSGGHPISNLNNSTNNPSPAFSRASSASSNVMKENRTEPKYLIDYPSIVSTEDRRRYKEAFNTNYTEYRKLHSIVDEVSRKFAQLEAKLRREEKGTEAWKTIKNQIVDEYQSLKRNTNMMNARLRFQYLHDKLSHIKRLVVEYDNLHNSNHSSS